MRHMTYLFLFLLLITGSAAAQQDYPSKPIRIVVPYSSGSSDVVARLLGPRLSEAWKQPLFDPSIWIEPRRFADGLAADRIAKTIWRDSSVG